jgi:cell division protein ZapA (FtsZ GTPase activity inhibitor)
MIGKMKTVCYSSSRTNDSEAAAVVLAIYVLRCMTSTSMTTRYK